jgi:hypothetical protein
MEVLIVAKTHMKNAACVGGLEVSTRKNLRLLNNNGDNQPANTDFQVGQIWDIEYSLRDNIILPHSEDVIISKKRYLRTQSNLSSFLKNNAIVWSGDQSSIFENKVQFGIGKSGYVTNIVGLPFQSVGFWLPDQDLELTILDDQKHFFYFGDHGNICAFPYVGYAPTIDKIKKGTLVRVSLARWWKPSPAIQEMRCYCQLSGWYSDQQQTFVKPREINKGDDLPF